MKVTDLQPKEVWKYFEDISKIPRPSKQEERIAQYIIDFAKQHQLNYEKDEIGNVLIHKKAVKGFENLKTVCLQSHLDMVCEKNKDKDFDFNSDAIQLKIEGEWLTADGTTLGADDGIGIATQLAILASSNIQHGPIECLFTVDEETGLTGAFELKKNWLKSEILLNLDSEDDGQIFIGCAGGKDTNAKIWFTKELVPDYTIPFRIEVKGLKGGHSGDDINKGLANANKIMIRLLHLLTENFDIRIHSFNGGNLRNAIAREAEADVLVNQAIKEKFLKEIENFSRIIRREIKTTEPDFNIKSYHIPQPYFVIDRATQKKLIQVIYACPHGVIEMSKEIPGFVETSTNLAAIKTNEDHFIITTSQRSSIDSALDNIVSMVQAVFKLAEAEVESSNGYPGWAPNPDSEVLSVADSTYQQLFSEKPKVLVVHAGLECGLIGEKYPSMDMISYGPDIKGAHSPDERMHIKSVEKFWLWTLEILKNVHSK
jgi:dipeptidase D